MSDNTPTVLEQAEAVSRAAQERRPKAKRGYTRVPNRLYEAVLRSPYTRVLWYIAWRTVGQKGRERGTGIWIATVARKLGLSVRRVKRAIVYLERRELIVALPSDSRHGAPRYRLSDRLLETDDEGRYVGGYTKLPNAAWVWLPFVSDRAWRLLVTLVRSIEPKTAKDARAARYRDTLLRRTGFRSGDTLYRATTELERVGVLKVIHRGIDAETHAYEMIGPKAETGYGHTSRMLDLQGIFSYPDVDQISTDPLPNFDRGLSRPRLKNPTSTRSSPSKKSPSTEDAPSIEGSPSFQHHRRRVLPDKPNGSERRSRAVQSKTSYTLTPQECRALVLGAGSLWRDMGIERREDGPDNVKLDPCPYCGGNDCSISIAEDSAGAGHCWNCGKTFHVAQLVKAVGEADGEGEIEHRKIVKLIRQAIAEEPPQERKTARTRTLEALATPKPRLPDDEGERRVLEGYILRERTNCGPSDPDRSLRAGVLMKPSLAWLQEHHVPDGDTAEAIIRRLHAGGWLRAYRVYKHDARAHKRLDRLPARINEHLHRVVVAYDRLEGVTA